MPCPIYCLVFLIVPLFLITTVRVVPTLYGDEYYSLTETHNLSGNIHAFGYFLQLRIWSGFAESDFALRTLSVVWAAIALVSFKKWVDEAALPSDAVFLATALLAVNPFFWQYATQIRFYSLFMAASVLLYWRTGALISRPTGRNWFWFLAASVLLVTSHFFGWLVWGIALFLLLAQWRPRWAWGVLTTGLGGALVLLLWPGAQGQLLTLVYRMTNPYAEVPVQWGRGLSLGMFAKIPLTLFQFVFGERVYPLTWWLTFPGTLIAGWCGIQGARRIVRYPKLLGWSIGGLTLLLALYLIFDPLAPVSLQGAAPRYLIFVLPIFWIVLALGAVGSKIATLGLVGTQFAAFGFLLFSPWSVNGGDMMDWSRYLREAIALPGQSCLVVDGRGRGPAERYAPSGVRVASALDECLGYERVVLISNDYRLSVVRHFDGWASTLAQRDYELLSNSTHFPAQITTYQRSAQKESQLPPARLDLPEQDLRLPLQSHRYGWQLPGFVRLDAERVSITHAFPIAGRDAPFVVSNYRSGVEIAPGAPVLSLVWQGEEGQRSETILRAGVETAGWDEVCSACERAATWTKRLHLVGAQAYPGAYRHYQASIWATRLTMPDFPAHSLTVRSLLDSGTVYYWGIFAVGDE